MGTDAIASGRRAAALDWRVAGILLGALLVLAVALQGPLGVSSAYVTTEAAVAEQLAPGSTAGTYFEEEGAALSPKWFLVVGLVLGALVSSRLRRAPGARALPASWQARFGNRSGLRFAVSFAGGFLLLFGARLADGCTSGHVISGMSQLAVSGMVFAAGVFVAGIPTALLLYGRKS